MNKLTENKIREIVNETVRDAINRIGLITEMAVPLKDYKHRVDGLRLQLVENWCLCKYCQLFDLNNQNFAHWITELRVCINNLKFLDIKNGIDKRRVLQKMLVEDYDYDETNMIMRIIEDKFNGENINDNSQKAKVCAEFADNINGLIDVIAINSISTVTYIHDTFS